MNLGGLYANFLLLIYNTFSNNVKTMCSVLSCVCIKITYVTFYIALFSMKHYSLISFL